MKALLYILKALGAVVYSAIAGCVLWWFFDWLTPYVLTLSVAWFVVFLIIGVVVLVGLLYAISTVLMYPLVFLTGNDVVAKVLSALPYCWFGFLSVRGALIQPIPYEALTVIEAICLIIMFVVTFGAFIFIPFTKEIEDVE